MALTKVNSAGIKDDAIVNADIKSDAAIAGSKLVAATSSVPGSMSAADKTKLDAIDVSADVTDATTVNAAGAIMHSDLGTKGQIVVGDGSGDATILSVGSNDQVLTADSSEASGVKWAAASAGTALTGSTNNTITTVTGANAIQGEANLTYDGSKLVISGTNSTNYIYLKNTTGSDSAHARWSSVRFQGTQSGGEVSDLIQLQASHDGTADDEKGEFLVLVNDGNDGDSLQERLSVKSDGNVTVTDGDLVIGTSGHGISFAATSDGGTGTPVELLDDYEEGIWAPSPDIGTCTVGHASYTKVGDIVTCFFQCSAFSNTSASNGVSISLPFAAQNTKNGSTGFNTTIGAATGKHIHSDAQSLTPSMTVNAGGTITYFALTSDTETWDNVRHQDLENNHVLQGFFTYKVA